MNWNNWLRPRGKWAEQAKYWRTVPLRSLSLVLAGIFFLFTAFGLMITMMNVRNNPVPAALAIGVDAGIFGVILAWCTFRAYLKSIIIIAIAQILFVMWLGNMLHRGVGPLTGSAADFWVIADRVRTEAVIVIFLIIAGYSFISGFMRTEGMRGFAVVTELRLATDIHRALVPALSRVIGRFEICGASTASGQMGGDLVDFVAKGGRWMAYVADVSGHGVPAGMIMAMVKSATRMASISTGTMEEMLSDLNRVLGSLSAPNVFVTFAAIFGGHDSEVQFSLAGHLPVLHYRKCLGRVEEHSVTNFPLAILPDAQFETASIRCEPGDLLAIVTDGLTEVSDAQGQELGLEPFKAALVENATASLESLVTRLRSIAAGHGKQVDDQTVLLLRHLG